MCDNQHISDFSHTYSGYHWTFGIYLKISVASPQQLFIPLILFQFGFAVNGVDILKLRWFLLGVVLVILVTLAVGCDTIQQAQSPGSISDGNANMNLTGEFTADCAQLDQSFLGDLCYFEHSLSQDLYLGSSSDSTASCDSIENPYLAYSCSRILGRPHMGEFATLGNLEADTSIPDIIGECNGFAGHPKLFCVYLHAASFARSNLSKAKRICSAFEDEMLIGECEYYISSSLAMGLAEDMPGTVGLIMDFCEEVSYPLWQSECYYVLADELALLEESDLGDIALACRKSSDAHNYWCNHHVVFEMSPERAKNFCNLVNEDDKSNCILGLGESLTARFIDNISQVIQACNETKLQFRKYCFEGMGRRLHDSGQGIPWRIEQCNKSPPEFRGGCLNILGEKIGYFATNVTVGLEECELLSLENRELCLYELSWRAGEKVLYDVPLAMEECESFPAELREKCSQDLLRAFGRGFYHDIPAGIEKCGQFPAELRKGCLQVLAQTLGERVSHDREQGMERCDALQPELRESCVQGLLCGFESCDLDAQ